MLGSRGGCRSRRADGKPLILAQHGPVRRSGVSRAASAPVRTATARCFPCATSPAPNAGRVGLGRNGRRPRRVVDRTRPNGSTPAPRHIRGDPEPVHAAAWAVARRSPRWRCPIRWPVPNRPPRCSQAPTPAPNQDTACAGAIQCSRGVSVRVGTLRKAPRAALKTLALGARGSSTSTATFLRPVPASRHGGWPGQACHRLADCGRSPRARVVG